MLKQCVDNDLLTQLLSVSKRKASAVRLALGEREIGIGSRAGFVEIVQRSPGRWDVPISSREFGVDDEALPWWPIIAAVLGNDAQHSFSGVVSSQANSPAQYWHTDSPHEAPEHIPAHAINVFVALHDIPLQMGPTECARGSHKLTNHLRNSSLQVDELIYQHESTAPQTLTQGINCPAPEGVAESMSAGSCLIFDDRLLHRGLANQSDEMRHVAYFAYRRSNYFVNTHFESQRSVYD